MRADGGFVSAFLSPVRWRGWNPAAITGGMLPGRAWSGFTPAQGARGAQAYLLTNDPKFMSSIGPWLAAHQSNLITAVILLAVGVLLAFLLRALTVRVISAIENAVPGRSFRTSFGGIAEERAASHIVGGVVFWTVLLFFVVNAAYALHEARDLVASGCREAASACSAMPTTAEVGPVI